MSLNQGQTYFVLVQAWNTAGTATNYTLTISGGSASGAPPGMNDNPISGGGDEK